MSLGLSGKFNVLQQSPHDFQPDLEEAAPEPGAVRWIPSRYNIRATTTDGRLVLWNSYKGTMSVFGERQKAGIEALLSRKGFTARPEGAVQYLFDRGFLVKEGTDEYRRIQVGFGHQHYRTDTLQFILLASEDCNFRCNYCYEDFARGTMKPWVRTGIKNVVRERLAGGLRHLSVSWFGGEPLYGFSAIEDLAPFFLETAQENSLKYSSSMTTNGYLLTPEVAEKILSWGIRSFQITLDGPAEYHDQSRPARDGGGTFATILENLRALHRTEEEFRVGLRVNFDRRNHPHIGSLFDVLQEELQGDPRFQLHFRAVGKWGGANDENLDVCGADEASEIQLDMKAEARRRGLKLSDDIRQVQGLGAQVCYAARPYNFIIGATGKVMKCTIDLDKLDRNVVGQLTESGQLNLDEDKFALWTEPAFERDTKCQKCVVLPACQGVYCPQIRMDYNTSPCSPLRKQAKKELRQTAEAMTSAARTVVVGRREEPGREAVPATV